MRVIVDFDLCQSNGECVAAAPAVFRLDDQAFLHHLEEVGEDRRAEVEQAARLCPVQAIRLEG